MTKKTLAVSEIFGPTFQGEGPSTGRTATFLRLAGCNLRCVWCDTKYTWDWENYDPKKEIDHIDSLHIIHRLREIPRTQLLVITGGEPLLQQALLDDLLLDMAMAGMYYERVEIETAGTIIPRLKHRVFYNVSPKLGHSGNDVKKRYIPDTLREFVRLPSVFKFVVRTDLPMLLTMDIQEVVEMTSIVGIPANRIWIMPEGAAEEPSRDEVQYLAKLILPKGWNLSTRLHVRIWGQRRGT